MWPKISFQINKEPQRTADAPSLVPAGLTPHAACVLSPSGADVRVPGEIPDDAPPASFDAHAASAAPFPSPPAHKSLMDYF